MLAFNFVSILLLIRTVVSTETPCTNCTKATEYIDNVVEVKVNEVSFAFAYIVKNDSVVSDRSFDRYR